MKITANLILVAALVFATSAAWAQDKPAGPEAYQNAAKFQFGQSRKDLAAIEEELRSAKAEQYPAIEARLLPLLKSVDTTVDAKRYICRYLGIVGSSPSVAPLAALLGDEQLSNPARIALEPMANPAAGEALRQALGQVKGKLLAGVISSVGVRRENEAAPALAELIGSPDGDVSSAAIAALGAIGTTESAKLLQTAAANAPEPVRIAIAKALTNCADRLMQAGRTTQAAPIYRVLAEGKYPAAQRIAGIRGLIGVSDDIEAAAITIVMLNEDDVAMRTAAIAAFTTSADKLVQATVIKRLPTIKPAGQLALLNILPDLPKLAAREAILAVVPSGTDQAKIAAINALIVHGEAADVPLLMNLATSSASQALKDAAAGTLAHLGKPGVDPALIALIGSSDAATAKVAITTIAARHTLAALPELAKLSQSPDAIAAIGILGAVEQLPPLVGLISKTTDDTVRSAAEKASADICTRIADPAITGPIILGALEKAPAKPARIAMMRILPRVRGDQALAAVKQATADTDPDIREAAIRTLSDWPELSAAPLLFNLADNADNQRLAIIATQGCIRLAGRKDQPAPARLAIYQKVMASAKRTEEKRQTIAGMGDLGTVAALEELTRYAADPAFSADAARAAIRAAAQRGIGPKLRVIAALEKFKAQPPTPALARQLDAAIARQNPPKK